MEGSALISLDKELLLQVVQKMKYTDVLKWCETHPRFRLLCQSDRLFYWNIIEKEKREEGLASIYVSRIDS